MTTPQNPPEELEEILETLKTVANTNRGWIKAKASLQHLIDRAEARGRIDELKLANSAVRMVKAANDIRLERLEATLTKQQSKEEI